MTSNTGPILVFPRIQPFGSDDFSSRGKVYSRHVTGSVNCERLQLFSGILHQYKSLSIDLVVKAFSLVLCTIAMNFLVQESQSKVWVLLSLSLLARTMGQIVLPIRVSPFLFDKHCIPYTSETAP